MNYRDRNADLGSGLHAMQTTTSEMDGTDTTNSYGSGSSHTHTGPSHTHTGPSHAHAAGSWTGNAMNLDLKYAGVIIAVKD